MNQKRRPDKTMKPDPYDESIHIGKWQLILKDRGIIAPGSQRWSDNTYRILGYEPHEVSISNDLFFKHVHPDDAEMVQAAFRKAVETCSAYDVEHRLIRKDGREIVVHETATCEYYYGSDQWVKIAGTVEDITNRRETLEAELGIGSIFSPVRPLPVNASGPNVKKQGDDEEMYVAGPVGVEKYGTDALAIRLPTRKDPELEKIYFPQLAERLNQTQWHLLQSQRLARIGSWQIILKDKDTMVPGSHHWSDETFRIFGYEPNEVAISLPLFNSHVHPDDLAKVRAALQLAVETCSAYDIEHRIIRKDGAELIVHAIAECERYLGTGNWVKVIGTIQDITERKKAEKYKAGLHSIFNNTELGFTLLDADLNVVLFNKAAYDSMLAESGIMLKEGTHILNYVEPARRERISKLYRSTLDGNKHSYELSTAEKDGQKRWYKFMLFPVLSDEQNIVGMAISAEDITEHKLAGDLARGSEAKYGAFFENSIDALLLTETDGKILAANPAACSLFGMTEQEICEAGRFGLVDITHPNLKPMLEHRQRTGRAIGELSFRHKDGTTFPGILSSSVYIDADGKSKTSMVVHDIRERKLAEEVQVQKNRDLRAHMDQLNTIREEERTAIAREIHDEIGQQLTALKMGVSCILEKLNEHKLVDDTSRTLLSEIDEAIKSVRRIASSLRPIVLDYDGLGAAIKWCAGEFEKRHKISCHLNVDNDAQINDKKISTILFRVVQETLTNVARHANASTVEINLELTEGNILLTISDNGDGINLEEIKLKRTFGLTSMKERVGAVSGEYIIARNPTKGTCTTVSIPYVDNSAQ